MSTARWKRLLPRPAPAGSAVLLCLLHSSARAATAPPSITIPLLQWLTLGAVLLLTCAVLLLWRGRARLVASEQQLVEASQELERRVAERTRTLHEINGRLSEEITRHQQTETRLLEAQDYLHSMLNSMPSMLIGVSPEGTVTHWNTSAERLTGIDAEQALGCDLLERIPQLTRYSSQLQEALDTGTPRSIENQRGDASQHSHSHYFDITVYPLQGSHIRGAVIRIDDVTRRVQLENLMIQNEKMVALGELAAGMAHEINNPLSAILQGVQTVQRRLSSKLSKNQQVADQEQIDLAAVLRYTKARRIPRLLSDIRAAGERAAATVTNMLEFSRYGNRQRAWVDLIDLVEHSLQLAKPNFKLSHARFEKISLARQFPAELPKVPCCAAEIQQVLLNLLRNASQALGDSLDARADLPLITVTIRCDEQDAIIEVDDNGPGIPEPVRPHIFDPFFTTKPVGKGIGLGLSICYFIIHERHGGSIDVFHPPAGGCRFSVRLPLQPEDLPTGV